MKEPKERKTGDRRMVVCKATADKFKKEGLWDNDYMIVDKNINQPKRGVNERQTNYLTKRSREDKRKRLGRFILL